MEILFAVIILGSLGLIFGIGLAIASKKFNVQVDPKLEQVQHLLPGANCGACGNPGCFGFAESLLEGKGTVESCRVCSEEIKEKIAGIMGMSLEKQAKKIATLHCNGGLKVKDRYVYNGINDCAAAKLVLGGQKTCVFSCLGFGTCQKACPFGAITMSGEGLPVVDKVKCRSCNKCVLACPKKLFSLVSVSNSVYVACSSHDSGRDVKAACPVGCIACKLCEKTCRFDAIHVIDNLAVIDYHKCTSCKECVAVCPAKTIRVRE
ncbi:MAG: RnfABCDGE type electron transport complex subunit B [Candidatus Omnitrophica bacterium]|nr:RnfABCDGE type electron transport complex subunit B [Candidatus Omnitrophota bacterium]MDD5690788.1 RnfABCDGE type electron transport complex subunit B [Candidatus Omnitrophota bacterium]